ncbi:hypothetical protein BC826DRAFT_570723 [Russula brevipes]|nr:hypothetical protein BC826DRAFT_570723 [Russula brevipes]
MQVSARSPTDQRIADAVRVTPYLTHVIRQHGQLALMPQDNSTHSRKPKREKRPKQERQQRAHEEPHFNIGAPRTTRRGPPGSPSSRPRTTRRPDVSDAGSIPDYPPPSFDEAIAASRNAPPLSPAGSTTTHSSSPDRYQPVPILIPPVPRTQNQPVVTRTLPDSETSESMRYSTQADYDSGSDDGDLEVISTSEATSPATPSEQGSPRHPVHGGAQLDFGTAPASARTVHPSRSQLTLTPHLGDTSQDSGDDQSVSSPSTDSQAGYPLPGPRNSSPSPLPPKRRLHLLSGLLKSRENHSASTPSTPTHAAASQLSLPLHFLSHPGSPSKPHRGEGLISRKLFGHKGKDRAIEPEIEKFSEPLETWDMLSDVERDVPASPSSGYRTPAAPSSPGPSLRTPGPSGSAIHLLSPDPPREGVRSKHRSLLNYRLSPPPLPLATTAQRYPANSSTDTEPREPAVPASGQRQLMASTVLATPLATPAVLITPSPLETSPIPPMPALLKSTAVTDDSTRGRALRHTSSMVWTAERRYSPAPSPTRSATTPTSPSASSLLSNVTDVDQDMDTPTSMVYQEDDREGILGTLPPSLVQEEEEEQFVTPPGSPVRSLAALPLATIGSRHPSPVRHEGRSGVTLRDDGPVPLGSPTRSEPHTRAARPPTITPRPSVNALHAFAPSNPSPLSNQSFERQAAIPPTAPNRDTVVSIGDTESLIELYVHSAGPTTVIPAASSETHATTAVCEPDQQMSTNSGDPKQYHYPGRPLPHPPGATQAGPVKPVFLDLFLAGNVPTGLPPYAEVESEKRHDASTHTLSSKPKQIPRAIYLPPSPLVDHPGGYIPSPLPPPALLSVLDEDAPEPSSPGSTYEVSPSAPSAIQREFTSFEALEVGRDDDDDDDEDEDRDATVTVTGSSNRENVLLLAQGTASPSHVGPPTTTTRGSMAVAGAQYSVNGAQLGRIQMVRRRVTRNGRVKLKLVLLGATVDRCVMCTTQFRDHESAALGTRCQHAFHERCAGSWLSRGNRTCPVCGTSFD